VFDKTPSIASTQHLAMCGPGAAGQACISFDYLPTAYSISVTASFKPVF